MYNLLSVNYICIGWQMSLAYKWLVLHNDAMAKTCHKYRFYRWYSIQLGDFWCTCKVESDHRNIVPPCTLFCNRLHTCSVTFEWKMNFAVEIGQKKCKKLFKVFIWFNDLLNLKNRSGYAFMFMKWKENIKEPTIICLRIWIFLKAYP